MWLTPILQRRYQLLLLALVLVLVVESLEGQLPVGGWLIDLLVTILFLVAFIPLLRRKRYRLAALLFGVPTVLANWTGYALPGLPAVPLSVAFHALAALFLGLTLAVILHDVHEARQVSFDSLFGGFIGYMLIGLVFSHLYIITDRIAPDSFRGSDLQLMHRGANGLSRFVLGYFSFTTLTTVGYGDVLPANPAARSLACLEAITGQFYIAVVMAELIGLKLSQEIGGRPPAPQPPSEE